MHCHAVAEIDLDAIEWNCRLLRSLAPKGCRLCAAVKRNAYGHGIDVVLPALQNARVDMLAVVTVEEAQQLRSLGWQTPILLMGTVLSVYDAPVKKELAHWLVENDVRVTLMNPTDLDCLTQAASHVGKPAVVHLMLDSGMSREGVDENALLTLIERIGSSPHVTIEGLYTHFATADEADKSFAEKQLERFKAFVDTLRSRGRSIPLIHTANSGATVDLPETHFNMIRPGVSVYGCHASGEMHNRPDLRAAMRLVSALSLIKQIPKGSYVGYGRTFRTERDTTAGLVPVGYGDGYDRRLSNKGQMIVSGRPIPVIGRVSMDQTILDLTDLLDDGLQVKLGQEVIVIDNRHESPNSVGKLSDLLDTAPQDVLVKLGPRVRRIAVRHG